MSGCNDCGRDCQGARCELCSVEHNAPDTSDHDDYECPECGGPTSGEGVTCATCRRDRARADGGEEESAGDKHVEVDAIETAPKTDDIVANDDEVDVTASVEERSVGGGCIIAGSAWDEDGVGIGGVAIKIPEEAREELGEAILGGEDSE